MTWSVALGGVGLGLASWPVAERLAWWSTGTGHARPRTIERVAMALSLAAALGVAGGRVGLSRALPAYAVFAVVAVALCAVDVRCHRLPDRLTLPSYAVGFALLASAAPPSGWSDLLRAVAAGAAMFGAYLVLHLASPGQLGRGDVKYAGVVGLHLGWFSWGTVALGAIGGFIAGGVLSLVLLAVRRVGLRTRIPFGPSMVAGALLAIALGPVVNDSLLAWTA